MSVTVTKTEPINKIHGFTYTDAAGLRRCHAVLFPKLEDAEAAIAAQIAAKPPGSYGNIEFFSIAF